ncbi:MAG: lipopolysaccharide biosynthesis protein [Bacilli bacterium]
MNKLKETTMHAVFFWNITGSLFNALATLVLSILVVKIAGNDSGGIFSLAFAGSQLMLTIACFEVRVYQSTDVLENFAFSDYFTARVITCILMMGVSCFYIWYKNYYVDITAVVMIILCAYRVIDAMSDVFQGFFQQKERLDIAGKALSYRVFFSTIAFGIVLALTDDLVLATLGMFIAALISFFCYDCYKIRLFEKPKFVVHFYKLKKLFFECLPLFAGAYMIMYVFNAPRNSIFTYMTFNDQSYFNQLFMPAAVINLLNIAFRPLLTKMALIWNEEKYSDFIKYAFFVIFGVIIFTFATLLGGFFLGIPILSLLFTKELSQYQTELMIILVGGGLSALGNILYNIITIMRKQYSLLIGYGLSCLVTFIFSDFLVSNYGLLGAAGTYLIAMIVFVLMAIILFTFYYIQILNKNKTKKKLSN